MMEQETGPEPPEMPLAGEGSQGHPSWLEVLPPGPFTLRPVITSLWVLPMHRGHPGPGDASGRRGPCACRAQLSTDTVCSSLCSSGECHCDREHNRDTQGNKEGNTSLALAPECGFLSQPPHELFVFLSQMSTHTSQGTRLTHSRLLSGLLSWSGLPPRPVALSSGLLLLGTMSGLVL